MNSSDLKMFAAFVSQRMEMSESEWFIKPESINNVFNPVSSLPAGSEKKTLYKKKEDIIYQNKPDSSLEPHTGKTVGNDSITAQNPLEELYEAVHGCTRCQLGLTRNKFVFGDGNPQADILFIGEAPGADEDKQGLPFVGRAGKLLTKMIEAIKLKREDVYIGNILKCRPPGNRDPKPEEIEKCEQILIRQIEIIKPEIICAIGRISGQTLLRTKSSLSSLRGKLHDYHGVKLIVIYHPAALLRNPGLKPAAWEDMKFLRREYDGMEL